MEASGNLHISCVWLSILQAEGADSQRPGPGSLPRLRTVPRPVSLQGIVQWVGFRQPSSWVLPPLSVPLHLWIPQAIPKLLQESIYSGYQPSCSFTHLFTTFPKFRICPVLSQRPEMQTWTRCGPQQQVDRGHCKQGNSTIRRPGESIKGRRLVLPESEAQHQERFKECIALLGLP